MTLADLTERWRAKREEWSRLHVLVDGTAVADEILAELSALERTAATETLTRAQAAQETGCHPDSITRLIRRGKLRNLGTSRRPQVLRSEVQAVLGRRSPASPNAIMREAIASVTRGR